MGEVEIYRKVIFEKIKYINEYEDEFWCVRELQSMLQYKEWLEFAVFCLASMVVERGFSCVLWLNAHFLF